MTSLPCSICLDNSLDSIRGVSANLKFGFSVNHRLSLATGLVDVSIQSQSPSTCSNFSIASINPALACLGVNPLLVIVLFFFV